MGVAGVQASPAWPSRYAPSGAYYDGLGESKTPRQSCPSPARLVGERSALG